MASHWGDIVCLASSNGGHTHTGALDSEFVSQLNFGGGGGEARTRKEIMSEVIAKSKVSDG